MNKEQKYSCTSELGAEILMAITSFFIVSISVKSLDVVDTKLPIISEQSFGLILSSFYAIFLPLMSFMFSQAKQYYPEGRAQQILIWMVLIEYVRIRGDPVFTWELRKSAEQLVRLFWVGFLVYSYAPLQGIRVSLFSLCILFAIIEVLKGIAINKAKDSYLIGKNTKLIHNYVKRVEDDLKTTPLNSCDYIVMGENYNEIDVCCNGYLLGKQKSNSKLGMVTVGRVFQLTNSSENKAHGCSWRETCLSFSLAKMLRRRFAKLPVNEAGSKKALNFVLEGLIDYIGNHRDIQTDGNDGEIIRNPMERVFCIIQQELKFVSDFFHMKAPVHYYTPWYDIVDSISLCIVLGNGVYLIIYTIKTSSKWFSLGVGVQEAYNQCFFHYFRRGSVVVKILSRLDLAITILLVAACFYVQVIMIVSSLNSKGWKTVGDIEKYIKDPPKWVKKNGPDPYLIFIEKWKKKYLTRKTFFFTKVKKNYLSMETIFFTKVLPKLIGQKPKLIGQKPKLIGQKPRSISSVFDEHAETLLFCVKVDLSILARLPKCIRKKVPRSFPTVVYSYDAKEAVLRSLTNSGGRLTNGEISLKKYRMESLNLACQPNGSTTEAILVWHIATTLFHQQEPSPQQNHDPLQEPAASQQNNNPHQEVALSLSTYCHYLVAYRPELLPDEVEWTEEKYESVRKDILVIVRKYESVWKYILAIVRKCVWKDTLAMHNDRCNYALANTWSDNSLVGKGAKLARDLINCPEGRSKVWEMLAEFWPEMMLFIAPSDNVEGHQKILHKGEFITQLWALLTHAGIVTRPTPTEHQDHKGESNAVPGEASNAVPGDEINVVPGEESKAVPGDEINAVPGDGDEINEVPGDENV